MHLFDIFLISFFLFLPIVTLVNINNPSYEEAVLKFDNKIFEYELEGKIKINNGKVSLL